jgi:hypothetical protein
MWGKLRYLILQIRITLLFHGQKEHSAYKRMHKLPLRITNGHSLGQHARKIQGPQGNCKNAECLPAMSVIPLTFLTCEEAEQDRTHTAYAVGEGTLTNERLRHISGNLTRLLKAKSDDDTKRK